LDWDTIVILNEWQVDAVDRIAEGGRRELRQLSECRLGRDGALSGVWFDDPPGTAHHRRCSSRDGGFGATRSPATTGSRARPGNVLPGLTRRREPAEFRDARHDGDLRPDARPGGECSGYACA
jgi:hypothetical protein